MEKSDYSRHSETNQDEAKKAFLKNADFLMSIDVYLEKKGRGLILVLNDKNPYWYSIGKNVD